MSDRIVYTSVESSSSRTRQYMFYAGSMYQIGIGNRNSHANRANIRHDIALRTPGSNR
jgi:hypothetical protein